MAEDFPDPEEAQDWPESQDDDQRRRCVGDERREEDAADYQLGKGMHHAACSLAGSAARRAISMTMAAPTSASRAARMPPSSVASLPASARAASQIPCGSRAESAVLAVATICDPGLLRARAKPAWLSRIAPAWSKHDRASLKRACCCGPALVAAASWAIRTASRNIASSGAHWRSGRDSTWSSSRRADASSQPSRVSPDGGGMRSCPASSTPIPATKNKTLNRKMFGS